MSSSIKSSSERPPSKLTYTSRQKQKKQDHDGERSSEEDPSHDARTAEPTGTLNGKEDGTKLDGEIDAKGKSKEKANKISPRGKAEAKPISKSNKPASSRQPKKVDVHLPGPSPPRTVRPDSSKSAADYEAMLASQKAALRRSSSISSIGRGGLPNGSGQIPPPSVSPPTSRKPPSIKAVRPPSPADDATTDDEEDNASVTSSVVSVSKMRRTEAQRKQYFEDEPEAGALESHKVYCNRCGRYVQLGRRQAYTVRPWENHRARCDQKPRKEPNVVKTSENEDHGDSPDPAVPFPRQTASPPPPSIASTEATPAPADGDPHRAPLKRPRRDSADQEPDPDARSPNRARKDLYLPPEDEPPNALGWFMLPFKVFMKGFRDSLSKDESGPAPSGSGSS